MRYFKLLVVTCLFFLALVFCFQNQAVLSQVMVLNLNLFFIPPMASISLPFYFLIILAFFIGVLLTLAILIWDKVHLSAKLMKSNWYIKTLEGEVKKLNKQLEKTPPKGFFRNFWKQAAETEAPAANTKKNAAGTGAEEQKTPVSENIAPAVSAKSNPPANDGARPDPTFKA